MHRILRNERDDIFTRSLYFRLQISAGLHILMDWNGLEAESRLTEQCTLQKLHQFTPFTSLWSCPRLLLSVCCYVLNFHLKKNQQFKSKDPFAQFSEKNGRKGVDFCGHLFTPFWAINKIKIIFRTVRCTFRKHAFATLFSGDRCTVPQLHPAGHFVCFKWCSRYSSVEKCN